MQASLGLLDAYSSPTSIHLTSLFATNNAFSVMTSAFRSERDPDTRAIFICKSCGAVWWGRVGVGVGEAGQGAGCLLGNALQRVGDAVDVTQELLQQVEPGQGQHPVDGVFLVFVHMGAQRLEDFLHRCTPSNCIPDRR